MNGYEELSARRVVQQLGQPKKNYEYLWQVVFLLISIVSLVLIQKLYLYQTLAEFAYIKKGHYLDLVFYSLPFAVLFTVADTFIHRLFDPLCYRYFINEEKFPVPEERTKRCYTLVKWMYSLIYYILSSLSGYLIIRQTSFWPTWLGGEGSCLGLANYIHSFDEANDHMKIFYILQFGKHLSRFFSHCFIRNEGNFFEYALHHGLSTFLILFSYLMNMWLIGIFVLLVHDVSDFTLILSRTYREYKHRREGLLWFFYMLCMPTWIGCRVLLFSYCCVYSSLRAILSYWAGGIVLNDLEFHVLFFPYLFMSFMLTALEILQIFWTYYIGASFLNLTITKKVKHTYD